MRSVRRQTGGKERMKEPDGEGVAIHSGPESCVDGGDAGGEALTGACAGRAIEPRKISEVPDADAVELSGRQHLVRRQREAGEDLARSANSSTHRNFPRGNREISRSTVREDGTVRLGKSEDTSRG